MARKTIDVVITRAGRDESKRFAITELPASRAEKWAFRAFLSLNAAGVDIPENIANAGIAGIALIGLRALTQMRWEHAEPLLDELFSCVKIRPSSDHPEIVRDLVESDIEEISTRLQLRDEVFNLHTGFSPAGIVSSLISVMSAKASSPTMPMSPGPSAK